MADAEKSSDKSVSTEMRNENGSDKRPLNCIGESPFCGAMLSRGDTFLFAVHISETRFNALQIKPSDGTIPTGCPKHLMLLHIPQRLDAVRYWQHNKLFKTLRGK